MDDNLVLLILNNPDVAEVDLLEVVESLEIDGELRDAALNHPAVSDEAISSLVAEASGDRRQRLLAGVERPQVLREWARSPDPEERRLVAFNPHTPQDAVDGLTDDEDPAVRANVVFNPRVSAARVGLIAVTDPDPDVREAAESALTTVAGWSLRQGRRWVFDPDTDVG